MLWVLRLKASGNVFDNICNVARALGRQELPCKAHWGGLPQICLKLGIVQEGSAMPNPDMCTIPTAILWRAADMA